MRGALFVGVDVFARGANISGLRESFFLGHRKRDNSNGRERGWGGGGGGDRGPGGGEGGERGGGGGGGGGGTADRGGVNGENRREEGARRGQAVGVTHG